VNAGNEIVAKLLYGKEMNMDVLSKNKNLVQRRIEVQTVRGKATCVLSSQSKMKETDRHV